LRDLQEPNSWVLIDAASAHSSPIPGESFVDRHSSSVPRVPRVMDFSRFKIMGVALSTCTMKSGTTRARKIEYCFLLRRRQEEKREQCGVEND
jgi:hypothetical protein